MSVRSRLVLALLVGPAVAAVDMMILYVLAARAHLTNDRLAVHVTNQFAFVIVLTGIAFAIRQSRILPTEDRADRFLALLAIVLGLFFALLIAAFEVPALVLHPSD